MTRITTTKGCCSGWKPTPSFVTVPKGNTAWTIFAGNSSARTTVADVVPYDLPEIVEILRGLADFDWESFLTRRVTQTQEALPLDVVGRCGYRIRYTSRAPWKPSIPSKNFKDAGIAIQDSIGLGIDQDGTITKVVPDTIGHRAGLRRDVRVVGVNNLTFSHKRLLDALVDIEEPPDNVELLLIEDERFRRVPLFWWNDPWSAVLDRDASKPDILSQILTPVALPRASGVKRIENILEKRR